MHKNKRVAIYVLNPVSNVCNTQSYWEVLLIFAWFTHFKLYHFACLSPPSWSNPDFSSFATSWLFLILTLWYLLSSRSFLTNPFSCLFVILRHKKQCRDLSILRKKLKREELDLVLKYSSFQFMRENKISNFSMMPGAYITEGFSLTRKGKKKCSAFRIL